MKKLSVGIMIKIKIYQSMFSLIVVEGGGGMGGRLLNR